jgi:hypothetical protein
MKATSVYINSRRSNAFTKSLLSILAFVLLMLLENVVCAQEAYLPLAGVKVSLQESRSNDFVRGIERYADARHYKVESGNFPKQGRAVTNLLIRISDKTFFHADNFRDANSNELIAYSHEGPEIWKDPWNELISFLSAQFGEANITPWKPHEHGK